MRRLPWLFLATSLLLLNTAARATPSTLVVFGDSLSDAGNVFLATGGAVPDPAWYPNGHFTDGLTYAETMWDAYGLPGDLTPSILGGTDFAFGGARSRYGSNNLVVDTATGLALAPPVGTPSTPSGDSFAGQIGSYLGAVGGVADPDALYIGWTGGNDVRDIGTLRAIGRNADADALFNQSIADVASALADLITAGARNLLLPTVTNLGLTPEAQSAGTGALFSLQSQLYNDAIDQALLGLIGTAGLDITRVDTYDRLGEIVADPGAFGLSNATDPCLDGFFVNEQTAATVTLCGSPQNYVFWDVIHPSSTIHGILADDFIAAVPVPMSLPLMMLGLAGVAMSRRVAGKRGAA